MIQQAKKSIMQKRHYKKGTIIFSQNENSNEIYILNQGILEVIIDNKMVAKISQRGVFFGEMAYVLNSKRNATIRTATDCNCIIIYSNYVDAVIRANPEIGINLMKSLAKRLKNTTRSLIDNLEQNEEKPNSNNLVYNLLVTLKMIDQEKIKKAIAMYQEDNQQRSITKYLSQVSGKEENDFTTILNLYEKYKKQ